MSTGVPRRVHKWAPGGDCGIANKGKTQSVAVGEITSGPVWIVLQDWQSNKQGPTSRIDV